jgi:hypothetical protein
MWRSISRSTWSSSSNAGCSAKSISRSGQTVHPGPERLSVFHQLPHLILVQPNRIRIPGDEFVDLQAVNERRPRNTLLLAVDEDCDEVLPALTPCSFFGRRGWRNGTSFFSSAPEKICQNSSTELGKWGGRYVTIWSWT